MVGPEIFGKEINVKLNYLIICKKKNMIFIAILLTPQGFNQTI